ESRLVGDDGRPRQTDRYRALFRNLSECLGCLHGHHWALVDGSENGQTLGPRLPCYHNPGHGACPSHAARSSEHRVVVHGRRWLYGSHAGVTMGGELPATRILCVADRLRYASFGTKHRVPRSWAAGDYGRSRVAWRPLSFGRYKSAARARRSAYGRTHYVSLRCCFASKIRSQIPGSHKSDILVRCRFRSRIVSAPSGNFVRRAVRCELLSLFDA